MWECSSNHEDGSEKEPISVQTSIVYTTLTSKPVRTIGRLESFEQIKLSFKTGGIISNVYVQEGERVSKGKTLATLKMDEIHAKYQSAESGLNKAERDYNRLKSLYEDRAVTLSQFQNAGTALQVAQSNFEIAKFNVDHSKIIAPENGYILKQLAEINELIGSGHPVFFFGSDHDKWKIRTSVIDRDVVRIAKGDSATVTIDSYSDTVFFARIISVGNSPDPNNGNYVIELSISKGSFEFFNGLITRVNIHPSDFKSCCIIPVESVVEGNGMNGFVFRVTEENKAEKLSIEIDHFRNDSVAVIKGLKKGEKIISRGAVYVKDGEIVREVRDDL